MRNDDKAIETRVNDSAAALPDLKTIGARLRGVAMMTASLHLIRAAGGRSEVGAAVETPRKYSGG